MARLSKGSKRLAPIKAKLVPIGLRVPIRSKPLVRPNVLIIPGPVFYSLKDEDQFFTWLYSLRAFKNVKGAGRELAITFRTSRLSFADSNERVALFRRYEIELRVLRELLAHAKKWREPRPYWVKQILGRARRT